MYYPYLRARQFELIALRELAIEGLLQKHVLPILEPVKDSSNNLRIANNIFSENHQNAFLILNPLVGELKGKTQDVIGIYNQFENNSFIPAFHYLNNAEFISKTIENNSLENCLLICNSEINADDPDFQKAISLDQISTISLENPERNRSLKRNVITLEKTVIRFDDFFDKQPRNSSYLKIQKHRYSEEHMYYKDDSFYGFSDFTVVPSEYVTGGSTPLAVAIHLTYLQVNNQIWIRHFTSNSNETTANVQGKFAEAAEKAVSFCRKNSISNLAIQELEKYFDDQHYPGLGTVKKIAIKNHILVITAYLESNL